MRTARLATLCLLAFACMAGESRAQIVITGSPGELPPGIQLPGMARGPIKTGTGRIRGRIVSADTGAPLRRAQVRISGNEIGSKSALSDAEGRFEFRDLPAGRFNLTAQKPGYMTVQYGQTRPFESGKAIELAEAQVLDKAEIAMPRGSVISGRIVDEFGDPIADATVSAMRSTWSNGKRRLQTTGRTAQTNDLGQYRLFGLAPGEYYVSATFRGMEMAMVEMAMAATAAGAASGPTGSSPNSGYAATYFPGTTNGADAQRLTLSVGQEAQGADFALLPVRLAKITGTVINSDGKPAEGSIVNAVPKAPGADMFFGPGSSSRTDKNGNFTINNVAPGDYTLQTRAVQIISSGDGNTMTFTMTRIVGPDAPAGAEPESGLLPISVSGEDISNVVIITTKGATATGHIVYEGDAKPTGAGTIRVMAMADPSDGPMITTGGSGAVKADDSFELRGLTGSRIFRVLGLPAGWTLKSVKLNGQDVTDSGAEFKGTETVTGLEILVTPKATQVNGVVKDSSGNTVKDYTVVFFAQDPQKWTVATGRYIAGVRPDTEGRFQVKNLPPGSYYAIAVDYIAQGEWGDPDLLEKLKDKATRVSLDEGEVKTLDLKIER